MAHLVPRADSDDPTAPCCAVVELRQYTLHPGQREVLLDVFERHLVEPQEDVGMHVVGTFVDLDDPDRFVWLRGFRTHHDRTAGLQDFYLGPVWARHAGAANPTMVDSDDVLLLRPCPGLPPLPEAAATRPSARGGPAATTTYAMSIYSLAPDAAEAELLDLLTHSLLPALRMERAAAVAVLRTDPTANGFPRLPVREGERTVVVLSSFTDAATHRRYLAARSRSDAWAAAIQPHLDQLCDSVQELRLAPTARSEMQ